jgi:hypothetical protein
VFCVSSRAYQCLRGRLGKDDFDSSGFLALEDTEIPQLQAHARQLTEADRARNSRVFLNGLSRVLNSMKMWASNLSNDISADIEAQDKQAIEAALRQQLQQLEKACEYRFNVLLLGADCLVGLQGRNHERPDVNHDCSRGQHLRMF